MTIAKSTGAFEGLRCPACGEVNSHFVMLESLTVECKSCGRDVTRSEVEALIDKWRRLFRWIDSAATLE